MSSPDSGRLDHQKTALAGMLRYKECWTFSWRGRFFLATLCLSFAAAFLLELHPFLAVTCPVPSQLLVIEGWVPNYALEEGIKEFKTHKYQKIFTTGGTPLKGINIESGDSIAQEAAKRLKWMGMTPELVESVGSEAIYRHRTYASAMAIRKRFEETRLAVSGINVLTLGAHARRSRLLYEKAFQGKVAIGIIAVENREYNPKRWWCYSEGVKEVISEAVAYLYVRFFFARPSD